MGAKQRRVTVGRRASFCGKVLECTWEFQSSLRDLPDPPFSPALYKRWAIVELPLRGLSGSLLHGLRGTSSTTASGS